MSFTPVQLGARLRCAWFLCFGLLTTGTAAADPWLAPGDPSLRSDLQLLADEGVLRTPVTSWPLSWGDVAADLERSRTTVARSSAIEDAMVRVGVNARRETRYGYAVPHFRIGGGIGRDRMRAFDSEPREDAEAAAGVSWVGERVALRLQTTYVTSPTDGRGVRYDGSYVGVAVGNLMLSVGYMEKFWGPGWTSSLILSNNARPVPSLTIERNFSRPFETKLLSWLGPWRASFQAGRLESSRDVPGAHMIALRLTFRPLRTLEVGLSRSAQLCGRGQACSPRTYVDMSLGRNSASDPPRRAGNQLAGFDVRYAIPRLRIAAYAQAIGEEEAGTLPRKYLGLVGAETWGEANGWRWRAYGEYANTSCDFTHRRPELGCAYESGVYTDGYRYRGRSIGHAWDRDARGYALGGVAIKGRTTVTARVFEVDLNRLGTGEVHSLSSQRASARGLDLSFSADTRVGRLRIGVGYDDVSKSATRMGGGGRAFLEWRRDV